MYEINVEPYEIGPKDRSYKFDCRESIVNVLFSAKEKLTGVELLKRDDLGHKILEAEDIVMLDDDEYAKVKAAFERFDGFNRESIELVRRVLGAVKTTVEIVTK